MINYRCVHITQLKRRDFKYLCDNEDGYKQHLKEYPDMVEVIGAFGQQIKPAFDLDAYEEFDISSFINHITPLFPNKKIVYAMRPKRKHKKGFKYSFRVYVVGVRILSKNLKKFIIDNHINIEFPCLDMSIYDKNKVLYTPCTTEKEDRDTGKNVKVPALQPINCSIFDCCASYIEEDYEDWDVKYSKSDVDEIILKYEKILNNDDDNKYTDKNIDFLKDIINHISPKRAENYDTWHLGGFGIIGACKKSKIGKRGCIDLIHQFSQINPNKYVEDDVDKWIDDNYKRQMDRTDNQYGYSYLIHTCLKEDAPEYYDDNFNKTYERIKELFGKEIIKINDDALYIQLNHNRDIHKPECFYVKKQQQLIHFYMDNDNFIYNEKVVDSKGKITTNKINIVNPNSKWWKDANKIKVDRLIFQPFKLEGEMNKRYYNMFQGFRVQHLPIKRDYSRIQRILNHIKVVICNNDEYAYNWLLLWLSALLMGIKTDVMIFIRGLGGCGKNAFLDMLAYGLIGDEYAIATASPEKQFFGNFNSLLQNRVLTIINEGTHGLRSCVDIIKDIITSDRVNIEKKGIDAITLKNYNNFVCDTNNFNIVNVSADDRRFVFLNCNSQYVGNEQYFNDLFKDLKDDEVLSSLYHYLIEERKCPDNFDFQLTRPKTTLYKKLQQINLPNPITFLTSYKPKYRKYADKTYTTVKCAAIYEDYKSWCAKFKYEVHTYTQFECKITDDSKYGITKKIDRKNCKIFEIVQEPFENAMNKCNYLEDLEVVDDGFVFTDDDIDD
jgi:hypothetical protein